MHDTSYPRIDIGEDSLLNPRVPLLERSLIGKFMKSGGRNAMDQYAQNLGDVTGNEIELKLEPLRGLSSIVVNRRLAMSRIATNEL